MEDDVGAFLSMSWSAVPARAKFVGKFFGSTLFGSAVAGMFCGQIGALFSCGPLVPFMTGAWVGYSFSLLYFWRMESQNALHCALLYPGLMNHILETEFPFQRLTRLEQGEKLYDKMRSGIGALSWGVLAAQSCADAVSEIHDSKLQSILEEYKAESEAPSVVADDDEEKVNNF